jgi:hypothetical protein
LRDLPFAREERNYITPAVDLREPLNLGPSIDRGSSLR